MNKTSPFKLHIWTVPVYTQSKILSNNICMICHCSLTNNYPTCIQKICDTQTLTCGHIYHSDCYKDFKENTDKCPICDVPKIEI